MTNLVRCLFSTIFLFTLASSYIFCLFPVEVIDKLWFFSLFSSSGILYATLHAKTLPEQVMGWSAFNLGALFIFILLDRLQVALLFFLWFTLFIFCLFFLDKKKKGEWDTKARFICFSLNIFVYMIFLYLASLTKSMLSHAHALLLLVLFLLSFDLIGHFLRKKKIFLLISTILSLGGVTLFAFLSDPLHLLGSIGSILFILLPLKGAAAIFVLFRAKTLPEQIMGLSTFNLSLILIFFVLNLVPFCIFLIFLLLLICLFFSLVFLFSPNKFDILIKVIKQEFQVLFFSNAALSVYLFSVSVPDKESIIFEHGVALSGLITFIYILNKLLAPILRIFSEEGKEDLSFNSVEDITELAQRDQTSLTQDKDRTNESKDKDRTKTNDTQDKDRTTDRKDKDGDKKKGDPPI